MNATSDLNEDWLNYKRDEIGHAQLYYLDMNALLIALSHSRIGHYFFLIFAYLWGRSHWSFRNYGWNAAIYNFFKPETNKDEFSLYFELFEKKF